MILPVREGSSRRRRTYSHSSIFTHDHKAARSSKLSLFSTFTVQSSGSNGSNSTVTQESYNKSSKKRRSSTSKRKNEETPSRHPPMQAVEETPLEDDAEEGSEETLREADAEHDTQPVNVFTYMVNDEPTDTSDEHTSVREPRQYEPEPVPYPEEATEERDFQSDSGICMTDGAYVLGKATLQPLIPERDRNEAAIHQWQWPTVPKPHYFGPGSAENPAEYYRAEDYSAIDPPEQSKQPYPASTPSVFTDDGTPPLSTDHLATLLASSGSPPLFKAFRTSNYRLLLQLQDEIMELEEEIGHLDMYDGSRLPNHEQSTGETSGRLSWRWDQCPFDLYKAKSDVLSRLQVRLDQYYKALDLSRKVHSLHSNAIASVEIEDFRKLLDAHLKHTGSSSSAADSKDSQHLRFLDDPNDLVLPVNHQNDHPPNIPTPISPTSLIPLLIPLIFFKFFNGVINRLLIVGLTLAFSLYASTSPTVVNWTGGAIRGQSQQDTQRLALACACISMLVGAVY